MSEFIYVELNKTNIGQDVLLKFDCGHPDFNDFLSDDASTCSNDSKGVTYVLVDKTEYKKMKKT